jgi:hypothetical protein
MFLFVYSKLHDLRIEYPEFEGFNRYGFNTNPISCKLPVQHERYALPGDCSSEQMPPIGDEFVNKDARGYFQYHTSFYRPFKEELQWALCQRRRTDRQLRVGLHYRAGDFNNQKIYWRPPKQWYLRWLEENMPRLDNPQLYVAAEEPRYLEWFAHWKPRTARDMGLSDHFLNDWEMLSRCDIVLCANSSFSFTAAMANPWLRECWRASLPKEGFEQIDPWNARPLNLERAEDYRHLLEFKV